MAERYLNAEELNIVSGSRRNFFSRLDRLLSRFYRPKILKLSLDRPMVSFTFDDIPGNAITNGARILERYGGNGSFFIAGQLCARQFQHGTFADQSGLDRLLSAGHELGCHTFSHADVQRLSASDLKSEFEKNHAFLARLKSGHEYISHAYPYGSVGLIQKYIASRTFEVCRGVRPGLNHGTLDLAQLYAVPLYDLEYNDSDIAVMIAQAAAKKAWLIFYTHDVSGKPSEYGTSNRLLEFALTKSIDAGCEIVTMTEGLGRARDAAGSSRSY